MNSAFVRKRRHAAVAEADSLEAHPAWSKPNYRHIHPSQYRTNFMNRASSYRPSYPSPVSYQSYQSFDIVGIKLPICCCCYRYSAKATAEARASLFEAEVQRHEAESRDYRGRAQSLLAHKDAEISRLKSEHASAGQPLAESALATIGELRSELQVCM